MNKPLDIVIVTGFGDKGIEHLKNDLDQNLKPNSSRVIASAPWNKALHTPEEVIADVTKELDAQPSKDLLLIGHSYGSLIALVIACRKKLQGILKLVLIDGPLRSDVEVKPAKALHHAFFRHYRERPELARECEAILNDLHTSKILTIGTARDAIVPPEAKKISTNPIQVHLRSKVSVDDYDPVSREGGTNFIIDIPEIAGHGLTKTKAGLYGKIIKNML